VELRLTDGLQPDAFIPRMEKSTRRHACSSSIWSWTSLTATPTTTRTVWMVIFGAPCGC